jgi:Protein of unknown function (DUF2938)
MNQLLQDMAHVVAIGIGATAVMDLWLLALQRLHVPTLDLAFIGRWIGHLRGGRWHHPSIAKAAPIEGELVLGWLFHYAVGIGFAALLVAFQGMSWAARPSLLPALCLGLGTVVAPLFVMQPAMGAGMAASKTPTPWSNRLRSAVNHTVFGAGLYLSAAAIARLAR